VQCECYYYYHYCYSTYLSREMRGMRADVSKERLGAFTVGAAFCGEGITCIVCGVW
jgi:hypothetical protein